MSEFYHRKKLSSSACDIQNLTNTSSHNAQIAHPLGDITMDNSAKAGNETKTVAERPTTPTQSSSPSNSHRVVQDPHQNVGEQLQVTSHGRSSPVEQSSQFVENKNIKRQPDKESQPKGTITEDHKVLEPVPAAAVETDAHSTKTQNFLACEVSPNNGPTKFFNRDPTELPGSATDLPVRNASPTVTSAALDDLAVKSSTNLSKYVPSDGDSITKCRSRLRRSSAPPESSETRSEDRSHPTLHDEFQASLFPPPSAPLYLQIITYAQRWATWVAGVDDPQRREELITHVAAKMEDVWLEGMRTGRIPLDWRAGINDEQGEAAADQMSRIPTKIIELDKRGRVGREKARKKRPVSPSREIVIDTRAHHGTKVYGITAGELQEAGITLEAIYERVPSGDLDEADQLLHETLEGLGREEIIGADWHGVVPRTTYNAMGRDLKMYCLWEIQTSRKEINKLHNLMRSFPLAKQRQNTQNRIDAENELLDQLRAATLELEEMERLDPSSEEDGSEADSEVENENPGAPSTKTYRGSDEVGDRSDQPMEEDVGTILTETQVSGRITTPNTQDKNVPSNFTNGSPEENQDAIRSLTESTDQSQPRIESMSEPPTQAEVKAELTADTHQEPPPKKLKLPDDVSNNINNTSPAVANNDSPVNVVRAVSTSDRLMSGSLASKAGKRKRIYIHNVIRPKANLHLQAAGHLHVDEDADWPQIRDALKAAHIDIRVRNELAKELNKNFRTWDQQVKEEDEIVEDIEGYPARQDIFHAIPTEGLTGPDLMNIFDEYGVDGNDKNWHSLVLSVAAWDRVNERFYAKDGLAEVFRRSLKVALKTRKGFNPEDYSSRTVNNTNGFRWRYIPSSTIAQREAMDEVVHSYVQHTKDGEKMAKATKSGPQIYRGRYEALINPSDRRDLYSDGSPPAIVHGIWDLRGRYKDVPGMEWFYEGKDAPPVTQKVVRYAEVDGVLTRLVEDEIEGVSTEDQVKGKHLRMPKAKLGKGGAATKRQGRGGGANNLKATRAPPQLLPEDQSRARSMTASRPSRPTAKKRNYAEFAEDSDDEYVP